MDGSCRSTSRIFFFCLASFCLSDSRSCRVETSPHAKIRKGRGEREGVRGWGREEAIYSWKTLGVPVILAGKEVDKKKKNHKNETQLSDMLRCYLLSRGTPSPSLFMIGCPCLKNELRWVQSDEPWLKDFTNAFLHYCCSSRVIMLWLKVIPPWGFGLQSPDNLTVFSNDLWRLISLCCIFCTPVASFNLGVNEWVTFSIEFKRIRVSFSKHGKPCLKQQTDSFPIAIKQIPFILTGNCRKPLKGER